MFKKLAFRQLTRKPAQTLQPLSSNLYRAQQTNFIKQHHFFQYRYFSSVVPPPKNEGEEELAGPNFEGQANVEAQEVKIEEAVTGNSVNLDDINLYQSFKEANELDNEDSEHDNRVKEISLRLMDAKEPEQVLRLFESEYVAKRAAAGLEVYGAELCMVLKFLHATVSQGMSGEEGKAFLKGDARVGMLIDWLMARYEPLEIEYKVAATFSLGMLITQFGLELQNPEYYSKIVDSLDTLEIEKEQLKDIPVLIYMLPCFQTPETEETLPGVVEKLSAVYFVEYREKLDLMACSTLVQGWARSGCFNQDLVEQMAVQIISKHELGQLFEEGAESEVINVLTGFAWMGYRNEVINEVLYECLVGPEFASTGEINGEYDYYSLFNIISSFARLAPQKTKYFTDFAPKLHNCFSMIAKVPKEDFKSHPMLMQVMVPDLTSFVNLWLSMATFAAMHPNYKNMKSMGRNFGVISDDLIKVFNSNPRWQPTEMNLKEAANVSVAVAVLKLNGEKFIGDLGDIIRMKLAEAEASDLPNLVKSSYYMKDYKYSRDIYSQVHARATVMYSQGEIPDQIYQTLAQMYSEHGVFKDSPFAGANKGR